MESNTGSGQDNQKEENEEDKVVSIVLFAILGATVKVGAGYWICFAIYCIGWLAKTIVNTMEE